MNKKEINGNTRYEGNGMPLIGIIAKKKDIQAIKSEISNSNIEIIEITGESIKNVKNIKFDEIIFMNDIKLSEETYKYMSEILSKVKYLIINGDLETRTLKEVEIKKPIKLITFGFNHKATITISSVKEDKIIVFLQRNIEKLNKEIVEPQEKEIILNNQKSKKIYNNLAVFIIKELHNI